MTRESFTLRNREVLRIAKYWGVGRAGRRGADSEVRGSYELDTDSKLGIRNCMRKHFKSISSLAFSFAF